MGIIKKYPAISFFVLAFLIGFAIIIPLILSQEGIIPVELPDFLALIAASSATLSALVVVSIAYGKKSLFRLLKRVVKFKVHPKWYLFAIFINALLIIPALGLSVLFGGTFPSLTQNLASLIPVFIIITLQAGLGEEIGWRGFVTPKLQTRFSGVTAVLIVGVVWSFWHLPLYFFPGGLQNNMWSAIGFLPTFLFYTVFLTASSVMYTWSYNKTGSLLIPILLHGSLNTTAWYFGTADVPVVGMLPLVFLTVFIVIFAGFIIKFSGKSLSWNPALDIKNEKEDNIL